MRQDMVGRRGHRGGGRTWWGGEDTWVVQDMVGRRGYRGGAGHGGEERIQGWGRTLREGEERTWEDWEGKGLGKGVGA